MKTTFINVWNVSTNSYSSKYIKVLSQTKSAKIPYFLTISSVLPLPPTLMKFFMLFRAANSSIVAGGICAPFKLYCISLEKKYLGYNANDGLILRDIAPNLIKKYFLFKNDYQINCDKYLF